MPREPQVAAGGPISHAIFRLARAHAALAGRLLREAGLHRGQEMIMMQLWENGPMRQTAITAELGFTDSAGTTRKVQRLERAGYVRRIPDPEDGRATLVALTPAGDELRARIEAIWTHLERLTVGEMTDAEQTDALNQLHRLENQVLRA